MKAETWPPSEAGAEARDAFERWLAERIDISGDGLDELMQVREGASTVGRYPVPAQGEDIAPQSERVCRMNLVWSVKHHHRVLEFYRQEGITGQCFRAGVSTGAHLQP